MKRGDYRIDLDDYVVGMVDPIAALNGALDGSDRGEGDKDKDGQHQHKKADDTLLNFFFHSALLDGQKLITIGELGGFCPAIGSEEAGSVSTTVASICPMPLE